MYNQLGIFLMFHMQETALLLLPVPAAENSAHKGKNQVNPECCHAQCTDSKVITKIVMEDWLRLIRAFFVHQVPAGFCLPDSLPGVIFPPFIGQPSGISAHQILYLVPAFLLFTLLFTGKFSVGFVYHAPQPASTDQPSGIISLGTHYSGWGLASYF